MSFLSFLKRAVPIAVFEWRIVDHIYGNSDTLLRISAKFPNEAFGFPIAFRFSVAGLIDSLAEAVAIVEHLAADTNNVSTWLSSLIKISILGTRLQPGKSCGDEFA
ncbi:MAG TPA: hypothetical protein VKB53_09905 [Gammaproteobacteria bacterium]|nr:hypothetical protein [Gammaproteobacteria bacterium]HKH21174.1 hypothetical protein [Gammaproteobacteria bacterium]